VFDDELPFSTTAFDPAIGSNNGDGIAHVSFQFYDPEGQLIFSYTDRYPGYCAFGGGDNDEDCDRWYFSEHSNQWTNGNAAQRGVHLLVVTIQSIRGEVTQDERTATLQLIEGSVQNTDTRVVSRYEQTS
jgi:hypothetical protein